MIKYKLEAAPTAISKEKNSQKGAKAKRIAIGVDAHLESYQAPAGKCELKFRLQHIKLLRKEAKSLNLQLVPA